MGIERSLAQERRNGDGMAAAHPGSLFAGFLKRIEDTRHR